MQGQEFFSTTKKLAILDKPGLAKFAEINKNNPMLLGMAVNELSRRKAVEDNQMAQSSPMGQQPTVVDAKLAEIQSQVPQQMASQGIAGLPAPTMEAMGQRASSGGIMRYAGGGFTNVQIIEMVREEAARRGLSPDTVERILRAENAKLDPKASPDSSSAFGLFQTTEGTWKALGGDPEKKTDVKEQIRVGLNLIEDNETKLGEALGRQPTPGESYTAHVLGLGTGLKVINADPGANVEEIVGEKVVKANPTLFKGKTVAQATDILGKKVGYSPTKVEDVERAPMVTAEADPLGTVEMPEERARTGLVKPKEFFTEAGKGILDIPTAYIPGLPGDIEGLGRLGLRAAGVDVSQETVLPGSETFRGAFEKAYPELFGKTDDPRLRGIREGASVAGSGITRLPGAVVRGVTKAPTPGLRTLEADLAAARQEAAALKDAATPRLPAPSSAKPAAVGPQPTDPAARLAAIEEKRRLAANAARAEIGQPPIPPKPAAPRPSAEAAEQAAESAARAKRVARDEAVKQLPGAEQKVTMLESAAQKAEEARRAAAAVAPGGAKQGLKDLARAATVGAQATMGEGEGGIRDLARGAAAPVGAITPDEQAGLDSQAMATQAMAFASGEPGDFDVGDPAKYGKELIDALPKEEKEGLAGLLGRIDNDLYTAMGIGLLSGSNWQEGLALGGQLYLKRKDAKLARESKAKETESEIEERKARTAESKARTKALEGGDKMRQKALELAQKELEKDIELMGRIGPEADAIRNRKLEEAYYRNLKYLQNSPVGLQSTIPGADFSKWGPLTTK